MVILVWNTWKRYKYKQKFCDYHLFIATGRKGIQLHAGAMRCSSKHACGKQADVLSHLLKRKKIGSMLHSCCHTEIRIADSSFWEAIPHACFSYSSATLMSAGSLAWKPSDCQYPTPLLTQSQLHEQGFCLMKELLKWLNYSLEDKWTNTNSPS